MAVRTWLASILLAALHVMTVGADEGRPDASLQQVAVTTASPAGASPPLHVSRRALHTDKSEGPFLGGEPEPDFFDLPITLAFLWLFPLGAITHLWIYRRNAKRGHKFRFSSTVFEFCMVRTATCISRIAWMFVKKDVVILVALVLQSGGASVLYVIGIFFIQRLIRAMHPAFGWTSFFRFFTIFLAFTVLVNGLINIVSLVVAFLSVDNPGRFLVAMTSKKAGAIYNMLLVLYPLVPLFIASWIPGPPIERFGHGPFRVKVVILVTGIALLSVGTAVRLAETFYHIPPGTEDDHFLYTKPVFYTTHFVLEILLVILYAVARIDLRFYVPDGCTGPGDYSAPSRGRDEKWLLTKEQIAGVLRDVGIPHEIMSSGKGGSSGIDQERVVAVFHAGAANRRHKPAAPSPPARRRDSTSTTASSVYDDSNPRDSKDSSMHLVGRGRPPPRPPRPRTISLRRSIMAAMGSARRMNSGAGNYWRRLSDSPAAELASPTEMDMTSWVRQVENKDLEHASGSLGREHGKSEFDYPGRPSGPDRY